MPTHGTFDVEISLAKGIIFRKIGLASGAILKPWVAHPCPKFSREPPPPCAKRTLKEKGIKARLPFLTTLREFDLARDQALTLFETLITPISSYGSEIWVAFTQRQLKVISRDPSRFLEYVVEKNILGVKRNSPSLATLGDLGSFFFFYNQ